MRLTVRCEIVTRVEDGWLMLIFHIDGGYELEVGGGEVEYLFHIWDAVHLLKHS